MPNNSALRGQLLRHYHDELGHYGTYRMLAHLKESYFWPKMSFSVQNHVSTCPQCQLVKATTQKRSGLMSPLPVPKRPWEMFSMDLIVQLPDSNGYDAIVVFVCLYSKMVHVVPTRTTVTAAQLARIYLHEVYRLHGVSKVCVSDRDSKFTSAFWQAFHALLGTKLNISSAYHPQTDGQTERMNITLEHIIRAYCYERHDLWAEYLDAAEFAMNLHKSASTQFSPFQVVYGFNPETFASLAADTPRGDTYDLLAERENIAKQVEINLREAKIFQKHYADKRVQDGELELGDRVAIDTVGLTLRGQRSKAWKQRYMGPYAIVEKVNPLVYKLALPSALKAVHPTFHISKLRLWRDDKVYPDRVVAEAAAAVAADVAKGSFQVESISAVRIGRRPSPDVPACYKYGDALLFLVHWTGYTQQEDSWEPLRLMQSLAALDDFFKTEVWTTFKATSTYKAFYKSNPARCPKPSTC